jgi:hypothetical protein
MEERQPPPPSPPPSPPPQIHSGVLDGISRLVIPRYRDMRHRLLIDRYHRLPIDRHSVQHLVDFLDNHNNHHQNHHHLHHHHLHRNTDKVAITELYFIGLELVSDPYDSGGLKALRDFFARSDTTITKVVLQRYCIFGSPKDAERLLAAFHTNRTIADLSICRIFNLEGFALGNTIFALMRNMPRLQGLTVAGMTVEAIRAFQPALRTNRTLKRLGLVLVGINSLDEGVRLLADALVGNTTMESLDILLYRVSFNALDDITRMIESTRLQTIIFKCHDDVFDNDAVNKRFAAAVQKSPYMLELIVRGGGAVSIDKFTLDMIANCLVRNKCLKNVDLLLSTPPPRPRPAAMPPVPEAQRPPRQQQQPRSNGSTTTTTTTTTATAAVGMKTCHEAIAHRFAKIPSQAGASAIFKLLQARPGLLEKRLPRPLPPRPTTPLPTPPSPPAAAVATAADCNGC